MRIFKGDKPAAQFEAGQQKGGNFYCFSCPSHAENASSYVHTHAKLIETISDRINIVKKTELSKNKCNSQKIKLYENLNKDELITELRGRNANFSCTESKKNLETKLEEIMHGIQRLPALMYYNPHNDIHQINLQTYEILFTEPLHDISNHIKNLYTELPYHIEKEYRKSLNFIINNSFGGKTQKILATIAKVF